ncbi:MAG: hypothetical protein ACD_22C00259G0011 [uncultured bacterium]|nr:MAG: hypothetical protein ACD_22C00259G0011 [uncultured bacterium]
MVDTALLKSLRDGFGEAIVEIAKTNPNVVVLSADLAESCRVDKFEQAYPGRFFQVGVAEQNMAGVSSGLALSGKIPFMVSYSVFSPGGNFAQIRTSICDPKANVKIIGTHAGLSAARDGATHQALEDIALMRVLPSTTVIAPSDYYETKKAILEAVKINGPVYIRLSRDATPFVTKENSTFAVGKAQVINEGSNVTIVFCGPVGANVMEAVSGLGTQVSCEVINCSTIKPLDEETLLKSAQKTKRVITVEEHQISGGLGGAVCELLSEKLPTKVKRLGINDSFGESGSYEELMDKHGLSSKKLAQSIKNFVEES